MLAIALALLAQAQDKTWESRRYTFTLKLPSDWTFEELPKPDGPVLAHFKSPDGRLLGSITAEDSKETAERYVAGFLDTLKIRYEVKVGERTSAEREATAIYEMKVEDAVLAYFCRVVDAEGRKYRFIAWTRAGDFGAFKASLRSAAGTLRGEPPAERRWSSARHKFSITLPKEWTFEESEDPATGRAARIGGPGVRGEIVIRKGEGEAEALLMEEIKRAGDATILQKSSHPSEATAVYTAAKSGICLRVIEAGENRVTILLATSEAELASAKAALLAVVRSLSLPSVPRVRTSDRHGFSVSLPEFWNFEALEEPRNTVVATFEGDGGNIAGGITVEQQAGTAEEYLQRILESLDKRLSPKVLSRNPGEKEASALYTAIVNGADMTYHTRVLDLAGKKVRFMIWCSSKHFEGYRQAMAQAAASLQ
jgi:hypothetical protein